MAAVDPAVWVNLEVEADPDPAVKPARPSSRADLLLQKLALQRNAQSSRGGAEQVSGSQKPERNIHSSHSEEATR